MIPSDVRLYTWVDVEELLSRVAEGDKWPTWLVWARVYWDGAHFAIRPGSREVASAWLATLFEPRFDSNTGCIILEAVADEPRSLQIFLEETTEESEVSRFIPTLSRPSTLNPPGQQEHPEALPADSPPVVLFYSFKGGVGRTLHAFAFANLRSAREKQSRTLLVDGDLEAPGLSWLLRSRVPSPPISYSDFLALVHSDVSPRAEGAISLTANRLLDCLVGQTFVLPSFRSPGQFHSLDIRPEHLLHGAADPFRLTTLLSSLGRALGVDAVVVDARAGLSELSAGLLLDPRVHRVLVTTLTSQSVEGTSQVLDLIGRLAPSIREDEPVPALVISQIPELHPADDLTRVERRLLTAAQAFLEDQTTIPIVESVFDSTLTVLPESWDEVVRRVERSGFGEKLFPLYEWIPRAPAVLQQVVSVQPEEQLRHRRERLAEFAGKLVFAESGIATDFLNIRPLQNLVSNFISHVPIALLIGAKGAGKTYTYLQIAHRGTWKEFARDAGGSDSVPDALICPVLQSMNLHQTAREVVQRARRNTAATLGLGTPCEQAEIIDYLRDCLKQDLHEGDWRNIWLDVIAWSCGMMPVQVGAGKQFVEYLRKGGLPCVAVFDGIEDLFQQLAGREAEQTALRALLQDLPDWLEQQPLRPLGLIVVVRQDMVVGAIQQNPAQLMALYEPYALKWGPDEALRLVDWIAVKSAALTGNLATILDSTRSDLVDELEALWGRKLGSERSKEAHSADWVIAALSDLRGQIQARDVVRFLARSAEDSTGDTYWRDRVLVPNAIRSAVRSCGEEKVREIAQENVALRGIFQKLQELPLEARQVPFTMDQVSLAPEELKVLEDNGAVLREGSEYYIAEVFRVGLDFRLRAGARPRVLTLARKSSRSK
jgi:MinD-like ATPase involved in chromosome partitioning or flagellar assembly